MVPPASAHALVQPGVLQRHPKAFSKPISIQPRGSVPSEGRSRFGALVSSLPPPISHPPPKPEERAGRHQRPWIWLPASNKTYLSLPSNSPCPLSRGMDQKDPPGPPRASLGRCPPRSSDQMDSGLVLQPPLWVPCPPRADRALTLCPPGAAFCQGCAEGPLCPSDPRRPHGSASPARA